MAAPTPLTREALEQRHPGLHDRLGVDTDSALAKLHGVSRPRIGAIRQSLGIPARSLPVPVGLHIRSQVMRYLRDQWPGTSATMAEALGTTKQSMSRWCSGARTPTTETLTAAAGLMGLELRSGCSHITVVRRNGHKVRKFSGPVA